MEHDWRKAALTPEVVPKDGDAANLTRNFHGGHLFRKTVRRPRLSNLKKKLYELTTDIL